MSSTSPFAYGLNLRIQSECELSKKSSTSHLPHSTYFSDVHIHENIGKSLIDRSNLPIRRFDFKKGIIKTSSREILSSRYCYHGMQDNLKQIIKRYPHNYLICVEYTGINDVQLAFGGSVERADKSIIHSAQRETEEEIRRKIALNNFHPVLSNDDEKCISFEVNLDVIPEAEYCDPPINEDKRKEAKMFTFSFGKTSNNTSSSSEEEHFVCRKVKKVCVFIHGSYDVTERYLKTYKISRCPLNDNIKGVVFVPMSIAEKMVEVVSPNSMNRPILIKF